MVDRKSSVISDKSVKSARSSLRGRYGARTTDLSHIPERLGGTKKPKWRLKSSDPSTKKENNTTNTKPVKNDAPIADADLNNALNEGPLASAQKQTNGTHHQGGNSTSTGKKHNNYTEDGNIVPVTQSF